MLDSRARARPRNYLSRREQRRLFAWVMGVGLVAIVCVRFGEISRFLREKSASTTKSVDTRFRPQAGNTSERDAITIRNSAELARTNEDRRSPAGVSAELLGRVHDDTPWIRSEEIEPWLKLWSVLKRCSDEELVLRSTGKVGFVELFQQPKAFRGKIVTIRGSARRSTYIKAGENAEAIDGYYRLIIWPEGGPAEPIFLYSLALPEGFRAGDEIRADIEATGFFFKRMVYPTEREAELRRAPVVMARTLSWLQADESAAGYDNRSLHLIFGLTALGIAGLIAAIWWATRKSLPLPKAASAALPPIDDREIVEVQESLDKLAESH